MPAAAAGFPQHWEQGTNVAAAFDTWFLNLFPRETAFVANRGGYATLSFVPTLGTTLMGLLAGRGLTAGAAWRQVSILVMARVVALGTRMGLEYSGFCPIVKRIWSPSWVLFSGGWCLLLLAGFVAAVDRAGAGRAAYPLLVVGANSIAAYGLEHLLMGGIRAAVRRHVGLDWLDLAGHDFRPLIEGVISLLVAWLMLWWMYRRRMFVRL